MSKILIVEDEVKLAELLRDYLVQDSFEVLMCHRGDEALAKIEQFQPDLLVLDLMLPGKDGLSICREVRARSQLPIVMVTAKVEEIDRLIGLELGADDYICKPFSPREVVARCKVILRRINWQPETLSTQPSGPLQLDDSRYSAILFEQPLDLTAIEFQLLQTLAKEPGRIYARGQLMESIYSDHRVVSDRTVDSHIKKLRKKIAQVEGAEEFIVSVYGVGYKWEPNSI